MKKSEPNAVIEKKSLRWYAEHHYQWLKEMNYSPETIRNRRCFFGKFLRWCEDRTLNDPREITQALLERYQKHLFEYRNPETGEPLSIKGQRATTEAIRMFFKWMRKRGHLKFNPAAELELPRDEHHLPRFVLTIEDVERVLAVPDVREPVGCRDRAIMEVLYSTGIRRAEVAKLGIFDVDLKRGTVMVRQGKGKRDRLAPLGARAALWLEKYLREARPILVNAPDHGVLFVNHRFGKPMRPKHVGMVVKACVDAAAIEKKGSCHLFRHAMATHLLENGADVKIIQMMLGHKNLHSTDAYTNMSVRKLKEVHAALHPAEREFSRGNVRRLRRKTSA